MNEPRVDSASRWVSAPPHAVYRAFAAPGAMELWLPPHGMTASMLHFDFREGGSFRMRLSYRDARGAPGKTSADSDETVVRLTKLEDGRLIEQAVTFESNDPAFAGTMRMTWTFERDRDGTLVTVRAEDVPEGISQEDHLAGLNATLENLEAFVEGVS